MTGDDRKAPPLQLELDDSVLIEIGVGVLLAALHPADAEPEDVAPIRLPPRGS